MKIGNVEIKGYAALAPMAGVTDKAFRKICKDFGASYVISEMVSSKGVSYSNKKSSDLMIVEDNEHPVAVQLFGNEPDVLARAAEEALKYKPDIIDINMGCPAPKIVNNGCGCALMKKPDLCGKIVKAVSSAIDIPVTVKIRKGWDDSSINALEIAQIAEFNGAKAITIHGRTREQQYMPYADWNIIKKIKENVNIPVIGNGDINTAEDAAKMLEDTSCDLVMIGRGALGNPWIFSSINAWINDLRQLPPPSVEERILIMLKHAEMLCQYKGEYIGIREARKHIAWYFKGFKGAASLRNEAVNVSTLDEVKALSVKAHKLYISSK